MWGELNGGDCGFRAGLVVVCTGVDTWATGPRPIVTIGNVVLTENQILSDAEFEHETRHADQWAIFGPSLPGLYGVFEGASQVTGHDSCWNVFEWWAGFEGGGYRKCG